MADGAASQSESGQIENEDKPSEADDAGKTETRENKHSENENKTSGKGDSVEEDEKMDDKSSETVENRTENSAASDKPIKDLSKNQPPEAVDKPSPERSPEKKLVRLNSSTDANCDVSESSPEKKLRFYSNTNDVIKPSQLNSLFTKKDGELYQAPPLLRPSVFGDNSSSSCSTSSSTSSLFSSVTACSPSQFSSPVSGLPTSSGSFPTTVFGSSPRLPETKRSPFDSHMSRIGSGASSSFLTASGNFPKTVFGSSSLAENKSPVREEVAQKKSLLEHISRARLRWYEHVKRMKAFQNKLLLRPSLLGSPSLPVPSKSNAFSLSAPKLGSNPFYMSLKKAENAEAKPVPEVEKSKSEPSEPASTKPEESSVKKIKLEEEQEKPCTNSSETTTSSAAVPSGVFASLTSSPISSPAASSSMRLSSAGSGTFSTSSNTTPGGFVFGQNLHERVVMEPVETGGSSGDASDVKDSAEVNSEASTSTAKPSVPAATATTNGTSEMLFTSVIQKQEPVPEKVVDGNTSGDDASKKSLSEAAREYEESRAVKRKYEEVTVITGEEEENNILQMDCKLFVYDGVKLTYTEGVHGCLRVNDPPNSEKKVAQSRVIVRMSGTLRVLMNTKIWAGMTIEKPNRKIVRMTAMDNIGVIKVFLISSSPSESELLFRVLETRIKLQKELSGSCNGGVIQSQKADGST